MASRRTSSNAALVDREKDYPLAEAMEILGSFAKAKFDETVEMALRLGIDPKKSDQMVRGAVSLPHGLGKSVRVIVFAEGDAAEQAAEAGALEVGGEDLAKKIEDGWSEFDVIIAHPSMMKVVGRLGRVLGPSGKMPSPKSGTVTAEVSKAVSEFAAGKVEFRADSGGIIHVPIGKTSFSRDKLVENAAALLEHVEAMKPASSKGPFFRTITVSSTMGPGIKVGYEI
jgi:large subunit ribosomal protein L1